MRKAAIILAGAAIFDLGVMAVPAQAQQAGQPTPPASGATGPGQAGRSAAGPGPSEACANGKHLPHAQVSACREAVPAGAGRVGLQDFHFSRSDAAPADPAPRQEAGLEYLKIQGVAAYQKIDSTLTARACIAQRGQVVTHEGSQQCQLPAPAGVSPSLRAGEGPAAGDAYIHKGGSLNFAKIDVDYTARTCMADRGQLVMRDGVQQCALPAAQRER